MIAILTRHALRLRPLTAIIVVAALATADRAVAQVSTPRVNVSFGIDTTVKDANDVVRLVRAYLAKPDSSARSRGLWSTATDFDRRVGDLTSEVYQGLPATIISLAPDGLDDTAYVIRVLYAYADSTGQSINPVALQRLYAIRESGAPFNFRLSGTLPRLTREWQQRTEGRITFWYAPGQHPNPERIFRASSFVDSVSKLFQVSPPEHLDMYVGRSLEDVQRATGLDFFPTASVDRGLGGRAMGGGIVLAGNPALGEAYLHELAHAILGPTFPIRNGLFNEGVATWLGGSRGRTPQQMYARLLQIQTARPALTLGQVLTNSIPDATAEELTEAFTATGALLVDAVYRRSGITGLRAFAQLNQNPSALLPALAAQLGFTGSDPGALDRWWRSQTARITSGRTER